MEIQHVFDLVCAVAVGVIGYLLAQKDASQSKLIEAQSKLIEDLYTKHTDDAERLQKLEVDVARNSYSKDEINAMFRDMKQFISEQFTKLEASINDIRKSQ